MNLSGDKENRPMPQNTKKALASNQVIGKSKCKAFLIAINVQKDLIFTISPVFRAQRYL